MPDESIWDDAPTPPPEPDGEAKVSHDRPEPPLRPHNLGPKKVPGPNDAVLEGRPLTEEEEQAIRDKYGYAPTEKRTKAERDAAADRMLGKLRGEPLDPDFPPPFDLPPVVPFSDDEELPPDPPLPKEVLDVWGVSDGSLSLAKYLIADWGLHRFLNSELHTQAVKERESNDRMAPIRAAYVKAVKEKEKKK